MNDCIFCKIAGHQVPCSIVLETDQVICFDDTNPKAPTHILIVPKDHNRSDIDFISIAQKIAAKKRLTQSGYRLIINQGKNAGQEIDHLHIHLLGGKPLGPMLC